MSDEWSIPIGTDVETLQQTAKALNRLMQVNLVLSSTLALEPLLKFIMEAATETVQSEAASIMLLDRRTRELRFAASTGSDPDSLKDIIVPLEGSIAGTIVTEGRTIIIDNTAQDPRHFRKVDQKIAFSTRSILGVPMRIKDRIVGVLEAVNKREGHFTGEDECCLTILASQAAVAIENARLVSELRKAYNDLNALDELKNNFISIASHELRTPLGVILGYASFLKEEAEGTAGEHVERLLASAMHLHGLIEDLTNLRFFKLDSTSFDITPTSLGPVLAAAHAKVAVLADAKSQSLIVDSPAEAITIPIDPDKLEMAITNLLNNAVRFTPEGGVIRVSAEKCPGEVWIVVRDNGIGIAPEHLQDIFEQFYQVEDPLTRRHGGLGLGLSIAQAIVERHGGRIWAESDGPGKGSTFTIAIGFVE
jgi:signal transduction histidine kinase